MPLRHSPVREPPITRSRKNTERNLETMDGSPYSGSGIEPDKSGGVAGNPPPIAMEKHTGAIPKKCQPTVRDVLPLHNVKSDLESAGSSKILPSEVASTASFEKLSQPKVLCNPDEDLVNLIQKIVRYTIDTDKKQAHVDNINVTNNNPVEWSNNVLEFAKLVPIFDDKGSIHPCDYVSQIEQLLTLYQVPFKPCMITDKFKGQARAWANVFLQDFSDFQIFKTAFLEQFWGYPQQLKVKLALESAKYNESTGSLVEHFLKYVEMGRHLQPPYTETILITTIARHYPPHISCCLVGAVNMSEALERLRQADYYYRPHIERHTSYNDVSRNQVQGRHSRFQHKTINTISNAEFASPNIPSVENDEGNDCPLSM